MLAHERMHIARADWAIAALAAVNRCVFWFNPLAWWMERKLAFLGEQACDDAALLETGAREPYAEALLDMAAAVRTGRGRMVWEAMAMARTAEVKKRIERILDESREIPRGLTRGRWAALVACSLPLLVVMSAARLAPAQAPVAMPPAQAAKVEVAQVVPAPREATPAQAQEPSKPAAETRYAGHRLVVLYFDVQGLSPEDVAHVRNSAQTIVGSRIADGDLTAIMANVGGVKVLLDFTDNQSLLIQGIESLQGSGVENPGSRLASLEAAVQLLKGLTQEKALVYFGAGVAGNWPADDAQLRAAINAAVGANVAFFPVDIGGLREGAFLKTEVAEEVVRASAQAPYPYRLVMPVAPLQKVDPVYPAEALEAGFEGNVSFEVVVGTDGHVRDVKVMRAPSCGGKNCGVEAMVAAAREAVSHYVYPPAKAPNGEPAEMDIFVSVPFRLSSVVTGRAPGDIEAEIRVMRQNFLLGRGAADSGSDHPARVSSKVDPEYPYAQRAQGHQGTVTVEMTVGTDGTPWNVRVTQSDPAFDDAVTMAVRQWRFAPARKDGKAVESTVTVPVSFRLE